MSPGESEGPRGLSFFTLEKSLRDNGAVLKNKH